MTVRVKDTMTPSLERIQRQLDQLPAKAYQVWVKETPIRSGNARRRTALRGDRIEARYAYAERLNEGWSRQSPDGMEQPTERFIQQYINRLGK